MMAVSCKYHAYYRALQIFIMNIPYKPQAIAIVELYLKETARQHDSPRRQCASLAAGDFTQSGKKGGTCIPT